ncbi:GYF domain-containing mpd2 [Hyphodiscus hymeniophilus]|uniref:GYF domain-containing mpd2 n=1 Tax=Hyphodiscus hymeniophilus TaxID=353542 RepID=A0A9P6VRB3_9HELO|nr:GYF domain-containing mpd2 [Hyphodiscus hymeniophilus]
MPSSFAAAAAGNRDSRTGRGEGQETSWSRRSNGAILSRRQSSTVHGQPSQSDSSSQATAPEMEDPQPQANPSYESPADIRYTKEALLDICKALPSSDAANSDVSRLFFESWNPGQSNGAHRGWGKTHDGRDNHGPYTCWESNGSVQPISFEEMTELERNTFASDVNSPLKPPPQNLNKDPNTQGATNGRKTSISHAQNSSFGLASPASSRPATARRQATSDSITGVGSPAGTGRFFSNEASPFLTRRPTDLKDASDDRAEETKNNSSFGALMRSNTAGNGPASPWGAAPPSATMSPMGNFGSFAIPGSSTNQPSGDKRPAYGTVRGESRFAQLMPKESSEDTSTKAAERTWRPRPRTDTDPFGDDAPTGSAALGGGQDTSPPSSQRRAPGLDTPTRGVSGDFGMSELPGFRGQSHHTPKGHHTDNGPMSPSDTNPYRSPPEDRNDHDDDSFDGEPAQQGRGQGLGGIPEHAPNLFSNIPRNFSGAPFDGSDRSQNSSAGPSKAYPSLGLSSLSGLGGMGGWPTSGNPSGTPDRENRAAFSSAFGNSIFSPMGDLQSPSLTGGLGGMFGQTSSTVGRGSKLGSLFPAAMQAQMQGADNDSTGDGGDLRQSSGFGAIGRNAFPPSRETDSPMRAGRGIFDDMFAQAESSRNQGPFSSADTAPGQPATSFSQPSAQPGYQQSQSGSDSASNQLPTAQQRMMVMPDRMRWVYLDPHSQIQGPWSGLEMHDWYKASFFTADLSVRKLEDTEFEPLGQLIRRIGNSREPFLVPQIGIPHGPPSTQAATPFAPSAVAPGSGAQPGSVLPPFAGAFPSFGTTLTAEQQNNLERRKQEEQYLMARQREFLAQQQVNMKQMQMTGLPTGLHHQGSASSLHSQPSFGSMTSPMGMPQQGPIPGVGGFFDSSRPAPTQPTSGIPQDFFRDEDLGRLSLQDRQELFGPNAPGAQPTHAQQINALFGQQSDAQREMARVEQLRQNDPSFNTRLHEFQQLRAQHDLEEAGQSSANMASEPIGPPQGHHQEAQQDRLEEEHEIQSPEVLSLTQQVQKAASAKESPIPADQPESPWGKVNLNMPMPFPPPPTSTTPLPAPTAQRGRSNLPEALNVGIRSRSETPEVAAPPSVAPWAKEQSEGSKGPSLKEIQELEAKQAAKQEEAASASRRVQLEQERKILTNQPAAPAPGLPTSSTWGNTASPVTPSTVSAWTLAAAPKTQAPSKSAAKTLSDIQREEEARKKRLAAASAAAQPVTSISGGKRYAELASKPTAAIPALGGSWSTVGAGGKVKIPTGPAAVIPQSVRAASSATAPAVSPRPVRPAPALRSVTSGQTGLTTAKDEFNKWAKATLSKGLNTDVDVDNFVSMISGFPLEAITDAVYSSSQLMDGRHFAEEFIRRRKLADKGVVEPSNSGSGNGFSPAGSGGWNEVAKKGPPKEDPTAGFKVIPNKKRGKK